MKELKRFVVELEWSEHFEDLTNEEMGILFKNFISYHKGNDVDTSSRIVNIAWKSVVKQVDRMNAKYTKDVENGRKGGRPKKTQINPKNPMGYSKTQPNPTITPKKPLNNPKVTYKDKDEYKEDYKDEESTGTSTSKYSIAKDEIYTNSGKVVTKDEKRRVENFGKNKSDELSSMFNNMNNLKITENETVTI
tara:strand:- start:110 stop:685 length:576 start_codon:yes stop_codon:yes gene_type:complete